MPEFTEKERAVAGHRARDDFYFFTRWMYLQRTGRLWARNWHHQAVADALMRVFRGQTLRLIINEPPRYSKTEQLMNFVAWAEGKEPDSEFIYTSYSGTLAENNSWQTREIVTDPAYRPIFPRLRLNSDKNSRGDWRTEQGGVVYAAGAGGTITGFGAGKKRPGFGGAIIIDDPHKPDEALSDNVRKGVIDWYKNTLRHRLNAPNTPIILIMQRLHEEDLAGWLLAGGSGEKWENVCLPAIQDDGTALWPAMHDIETLQKMARAMPYDFAGQYQQKAAPAAGNLFKPDNIGVVDVIPFGTRFVRGWDFAATDHSMAPATAGMKLGQMPDGRYLIADIRRLQDTPEEVEKALKNCAAADGIGVEIDIPQDPGQAGKSQVSYFIKALAGFVVHSSPESGDKVTRAKPFAAQVNVGNVLMLRAPWNDSLIAEMRVFPNGRFKDQVDAGSRAFARLSGGGTWSFASV